MFEAESKFYLGDRVTTRGEDGQKIVSLIFSRAPWLTVHLSYHSLDADGNRACGIGIATDSHIYGFSLTFGGMPLRASVLEEAEDILRGLGPRKGVSAGLRR